MTHVVVPSDNPFHLHYDQIAGNINGVSSTKLNNINDTTFVFICFTNRCGSNYISESLHSDRQLNLASECYNSDEVLRVMRSQNINDFGTYISGITLHQRRSGFFLSKVAADHITVLFKFGVLERIFARSCFVFIERSDKLGQAISMCIAESTAAWASYSPTLVQPEDVEFCAERIDYHIELILCQNLFFERFFAYNGIQPIRLVYENFETDPVKMTEWLGKELGIPTLRFAPENVVTKRQRSIVNNHWRRQYLDLRGSKLVNSEL